MASSSRHRRLTVDGALLARGRDRYDIYCSPCHSRAGDGRGMVALRGFRYPPSFHSDRLRRVPDGYIYAVITNGYGAMSDYAYQLEPRDRWAVTEYVRVLQFSRNAQAADLDASDREALDRASSPAPEAALMPENTFVCFPRQCATSSAARELWP